MSVALPITRDDRRRDIVAAAGQTVFSFGLPLFDVDDLAVLSKISPATRFSTLASGFVTALVDAGASGATVTFTTAPRPTSGDPAVTLRLQGARVAERTLDVTRGGSLSSAALERELDKVSVTLQEVRRDVDLIGDLDAAAADAEAAAVAASGSATSAAADRALAVAAASAASAISAVNLGVWTTRAAFAAATIGAGVQAVILLGLATQGDCPKFLMVKRGSQPSHAGKVQTADGAWWEISEPVIYPQQIGAIGAGNDRTTLLNADGCAAALGSDLILNKAHAVATSLTFSAHVRFVTGGKLTPAAAALIDFLSGFEAPLHYRIFDFSAAGSGLTHSGFARITQRELYPQMFGAVGDYSTSCSAAFDQCWQAMAVSNLPVYTPPGRYKMNARSNFDIGAGNIYNNGFQWRGAGRNNSLLDYRGLTGTTAALIIENATVAHTDNVYFDLADIGIMSDNNGPALQLGQFDYHDPQNEWRVAGLWVQNFCNLTVQDSSTNNTQGVVMNYCLNGSFDINANTASLNNGFALRLNQVQFSRFFGSVGTASVGEHLTGGINGGNAHDAMDYENCGICVQSDSTGNKENIWRAGTWNYTVFGFYDAFGQSAIVDCPQVNPSSPATAADFVGGRGTGVTVRFADPQQYPVAAPAANPVFGTPYVNTTGQKVKIHFWWSSSGSTVTSFSFTPKGGSLVGIGVTNIAGGWYFELNPGDTIQANGSGSNIAWLWMN